MCQPTIDTIYSAKFNVEQFSGLAFTWVPKSVPAVEKDVMSFSTTGTDFQCRHNTGDLDSYSVLVDYDCMVYWSSGLSA